MELAARVAERISIWNPDAVFVDDGGVGGGVVDRYISWASPVIGVNFGGKADRGGMGSGRQQADRDVALGAGVAPARLAPRDELLAAELTAPMYTYNAANALMLEPRPT